MLWNQVVKIASKYTCLYKHSKFHWNEIPTFESLSLTYVWVTKPYHSPTFPQPLSVSLSKLRQTCVGENVKFNLVHFRAQFLKENYSLWLEKPSPTKIPINWVMSWVITQTYRWFIKGLGHCKENIQLMVIQLLDWSFSSYRSYWINLIGNGWVKCIDQA